MPRRPSCWGPANRWPARWIDGVMEKNELIDQDSNLRALFFWGHAPNSQSRGVEMKRALDKLDLYSQRIPADINPAQAQAYIVNPLRRGGMASLFSTHPPVEERISRLRGGSWA